MSFLHPEFQWLIPLVALPILIHLLTRLRYRRVRWAAIDFLINSERKAVRRARLQQILLMILRTLVLACALLALLEPILHGVLGRLLGGGGRVVVLLDGSASMSSPTADRTAFERARQSALNALNSFPRGAAAAFALMAGETQVASREPLRDIEMVKNSILDARRTDGAANVPQAIRQAAETLQRGGGSGVIWILTDSQASDWRASDTGDWETTREALRKAGKPQIVITTIERSPGVNFSISGISMSPPIPVEGDQPRLTATIQIHSPPDSHAGGLTNVQLFFDGELAGSGSATFREPTGKADCVFRLPKLKRGAHSGFLKLEDDAIMADNLYYFSVNTEERVPVLIVDFSPNADSAAADLRSASHLLALALKPPESEGGYRSPFQPKIIAATALEQAALQPYAAIFLTNPPPAFPDSARDKLDAFVQDGGLVVIFPGEQTDPPRWAADKFPRLTLRPAVTFPEKHEAKVVPVGNMQNPLISTLSAEGLDTVFVSKLFPILAGSDAPDVEVLLCTDEKQPQPFMVVEQEGRGRVFCFAVSAQDDFSNLPLTRIFLPTIHRIVRNHLVERGLTNTRRAFAPLIIPIQTDMPRVLTPDGRVVPLTAMKNDPAKASFDDTGVAGIYRLTAATPDAPLKVGTDDQGPIVGVINAPPEESDLDPITRTGMTALLKDTPPEFMAATGDLAAAGQQASAGEWTFPFAAAALVALLAAVILAWAIGRPAAAKEPARENPPRVRADPRQDAPRAG